MLISGLLLALEAAALVIAMHNALPEVLAMVTVGATANRSGTAASPQFE